MIGFSPVRRFSGYGELLVGVNRNYKQRGFTDVPPTHFPGRFALLVTAAPGSILAAEVTATYPVGGLCFGLDACTVQDFDVTTNGALLAEVTVTSITICETAGVRFSRRWNACVHLRPDRHRRNHR